jgi:hypothetical protein
MRRVKVTDTITVGRGVKIPIATILAAIPSAIKAAKESAADNRDEDSPGGVKVTAGEVAEDAGAFFAKLAEKVVPDLIELNTK